MSNIFIIGSGLSAVSAAVALVNRGHKPTILDVGLGPEQEAVELKNELAGCLPGHPNCQALDQLKQMDRASACGIPRKRWFGSDFPFRSLEKDCQVESVEASMVRSYAEGGLSNVWGAALQKVTASDVEQWPLALEELAPYYDQVLNFLDLNGNPATNRLPSLRLSLQARALLDDLESHRQKLARQGISYGPSQLAVRSQNGGPIPGCAYCGLCLSGCPYDCIYTAAGTLRQLREMGKIRYFPGLFVEKILRTGNQLAVEVWNLHENRREALEGSLILVGAGLLSTARISLESLSYYDRPLTIRHSDMFTLPFLRFRGDAGVFTEALHTLSQVFIELEDLEICARRVHLQVYTYNDLYLPLLESRFGAAGRLLHHPVRALVSRLLIIFGYLPSDVSSSIEIVLPSGGCRKVVLLGKPNARSVVASRKVAWRLLRRFREFGGIPLVFQMAADLPGGGYHSGGLFPMSSEPVFPATDLLGRLPLFEHVHLIDASVLPDVPAIPTAFTVMANAYRIASLCPVPE
ncbi:MAG: hypothetical protein EHM61_09115 [Acidobacteria bacterium]|nr:MAG: hypothetical protein EHM61_09115 [Acidobacteriota bacterium]